MARKVPVLCVYTTLGKNWGYSKDGWEIHRGEAVVIALPFISDATQEKRGRHVWGLSSSDINSCRLEVFDQLHTLRSLQLHLSGSAEPNQLLLNKRRLVPQSQSLVLMTPEAWCNSSLGYFVLLSLNTGFCFLVPQFSNTLIFALYLISPCDTMNTLFSQMPFRPHRSNFLFVSWLGCIWEGKFIMLMHFVLLSRVF